jgi:hypothetical protein
MIVSSKQKEWARPIEEEDASKFHFEFGKLENYNINI